MNWKLLGLSPKEWTDNYKCATAARGHNTLTEQQSLLDLEDTAESSFCLFPSVPAEPATFGETSASLRAHPTRRRHSAPHTTHHKPAVSTRGAWPAAPPSAAIAPRRDRRWTSP